MRRPPLLCVTLSLLAPPTTAQLDTGDLILTAGADRVMINQTLPGGGISPASVFAATLTSAGPGPFNSVDEPGFESLPGEFLLDQVIGISFPRALRRWTPSPHSTTGGTFCSLATARLEARKTGNAIQTPLADSPLTAAPSLELGFTDPTDGHFHEHALFVLGAPAEPGIYALEVVVWAQSPLAVLPAPSHPVWILFNQQTPEAELTAAATSLRSAIQAGVADPLCAPTCSCDWNRSATLTVQDIFDFLDSYFSQSADFNSDTSTTVQDIFDFLSCYFAGC